MGISASGKIKFSSSNVAKVIITVALFLVLFIFFYGPPLIPALRNAAIDQCNDIQGGDYRSYHLQWKSWTLNDQPFPHWLCTNLETFDPNAHDLGWWAGFKG